MPAITSALAMGAALWLGKGEGIEGSLNMDMTLGVNPDPGFDTRSLRDIRTLILIIAHTKASALGRHAAAA
jgi:hypothetical protein